MNSVYIAVASWEPRFVLGIEKSLQRFQLGRIIVLFSSRSSNRTASNRAKVAALCEKHFVSLDEVEVDFEDQIKIYRQAAGLDLALSKVERVFFDISTSPRDVSIIFGRALRAKMDSFTFIYYPAEKYGNWLSKEAGSAKIVVGASGLMYPDKPTCVLALYANSIERLEQIYNHFEPSKLLLLWDPRRSEYGVPELISDEIRVLSEQREFNQTDFSEENRQYLIDLAKSLIDDFNLVVMSTGPKLGIVHILNLIEVVADVAAAYIPSRFYNDDYSFGVAEPMLVEFPFSTI